jgi:hypothetical protein
MESSKAGSKQARLTQLKRKAPRGQAMVEYSVVSHFLLMGGSAVMMKVIPRLFEAINAFYDSVYTVIETAAL